MIPKIIHQTARTSIISWEERQLVKKIKSLSVGWTYMFHDDADNEQLIKKNFPEYLDKYNAISKGVAKADIARLVYMYVYGGFYFDTDYRLLKTIPSWMLSENQLLMESRNSSTEYKLGNAILASSPKGVFFKDLIEHILLKPELQSLQENSVELVTGPEALTEFYLANKAKYEKCVTIIPRTYFNPPVLYHGLSIVKTDKTVGVHYCWGSWRSGNIFKRIYIFLKRKIQAII